MTLLTTIIDRSHWINIPHPIIFSKII